MIHQAKLQMLLEMRINPEIVGECSWTWDEMLVVILFLFFCGRAYLFLVCDILEH